MANVDISKIIVAIDAGHGSNTAGKRTPDGYKEHWINVKCAYYCEQYLKSFGIKTFRVAWDDTNAKDDTDVSLTTRQKQIKNKGCYLVVSFHANAYGSGWNSAKGVETLVHNVKAKRGDSVALAKDIQKQIIKGIKQNNRGVKYQTLAMCNCSAMKVKASALVEIGFMTNEHEAGLMKTDAFCKEQGEDVARGILAYLGIDYNKNKVVLAGAIKDEKGNPKNGKAGDQLQTSSTNDEKGEVRFRDFYIHSKGWLGFSFIKDEHAKKFIEAMKQSVNNKNIGYDQNNRYDIIEKLKKYGTLEKISVPTECVCSSLIRASIIQATGKDLGEFFTDDMPELFKKSGLFNSKVVVDSENDVEDGMILVTKTKGHTEAVISGKPRKKIENEKDEYVVKITSKTLNIRKSASASSKVVGVITDDEKLIKKNPDYYFKKTNYIIVGEKMNGKTKWLQLKSGIGYISANYTKKV